MGRYGNIDYYIAPRLGNKKDYFLFCLRPRRGSADPSTSLIKKPPDLLGGPACAVVVDLAGSLAGSGIGHGVVRGGCWCARAVVTCVRRFDHVTGVLVESGDTRFAFHFGVPSNEVYGYSL